MALYLVLLSTFLAFSLTSTEQYVPVSSPGFSISLSLDSMKNASGLSITRVDTGRYTKKENPQPLTENVYQGMSNETEQLVSVAFGHPPLHDTSMSSAVQPIAASTSTTTATTPSSTANTSSTTTTTTTTPKSCPQSGYQQFPEFNCYKIFSSYDEWKTWSEAREQCKRDGGDLMVIESEQERTDVYIPLYNSVGLRYKPWVGVYVAQVGGSWMTVKGQPPLSTWWLPGYPDKYASRKCAVADYSGLLRNWNCAAITTFICEISL